MSNGIISYDICDLIYFPFEDLKEVIRRCSDEDLFHAFITMPNEVTYKCQLFFSDALLIRRSKGLYGLGPIPLETVNEAQKKIVDLMTSIRRPEELVSEDMAAKVYVKLLQREKDVWRGVNALRFDQGIYYIRDYPANLPELYEEWEFPMTSIVKVRPITKNGKIHLIAFEKYTGQS